MKRVFASVAAAIVAVCVFAGPAEAKSSVPASCKRAFDAAEQVFAESAKVAGGFSTYLDDGDVDALTAVVTAANDRLDVVSKTYRKERAACLAGK